MKYNKHKKIILAIDGFSSSGKSTLARAISKKLKYKYLDTGAMYRSIALLAIREKVFNSDLWNIKKFIHLLKKTFQVKWNKKINEIELFLNKKNVKKSEIRSIEVSKKVSFIAKIPDIREILTSIQRNFGVEKGIVVDGRDIGTTVFPKSELKIFLKSSIEVRSYRRYQDIKKTNDNIIYDEVKKDLIYRDIMDINRKNSPLKKSVNAIEIDNTYLNIEKELNIINNLLINKIK
ncbi:(d)CMP kinase [Blattabacterium cuenoti]|uniref:(d)CMP kinase n=1 Tax=Blattabacterium cuenoti TaxID=1653831 RepID=UPI00163BE21B|nr:(d)CMP kinase [Blattabacterium cuenoti]